jgi:hypothetical protein
MTRTHRTLGALGAAAAVALVPLSGSADALDQPFLITTSTQTATSTASHRAVLVVHADGASDASTAERDRSCYAVLQRVLSAGSPRKPYTIGVALDADTIVNVPVTANLAQPGAGARLIDATGAGIARVAVAGTANVPLTVHVEAHVLAQDGRLESATFREMAYLATPDQTVEVSDCALQRLPTIPPASDATATTPV